MREYCPIFVLTGKMFELVSNIMEIIGKLDKFDNLNDMPVLRKNNKIKSIHSSLVIENNSLSIKEVKDIISGKEVVGPINEIKEVKNIYTLYEKMDELNPYIVNDLLTSHKILLSGIDKDCGKFRLGNEGVFDGDNCIFIAPSPHMVNTLIDNLFKYINDSYEFLHPLILSSIFHYEFVFIHPFKDGNGRIARFWQTLLLSKWKLIFGFLPIESQIYKYQNKYYEVINECNNKGECTLFIEIMLEIILKTLEELQAILLNDNKNFYVKKILSSIEYGEELSAYEIMGRLGIKSKENFRKNYLNPSIENGYIKCTLPDRMTSKNQKYYKI